MEIQITTDLEVIPQQIAFNYDALKTELTERTEFYRNLVVTSDSISEAKESRAKLNKLKTAVEDKRKEIKKRINEPYAEFEKRIKELTGIIDTAIANIDGQTARFTEIKQQEKYKEITEFYKITAAEHNLLGIVPLDKVLNEKWKNATMDIEKLKAEMSDRLTKIRSELRVLETTCKNNGFIEAVRAKYTDTLDMSAALMELKRLEEQKRLFELAEEEKAKKAALEEKKPETVPEEPAPLPVPEAVPVTEDIPKEETKTIDVRFFDTTAAFRADMKALVIKHGLKYGNVPKGV